MLIPLRGNLARFAFGALLSVGVMSCTGSTLVAQHAPTPTADTRYRAGDRIYLDVQGEKALTDTFTVAEGPALLLPDIGKVSLVGVTYADLEQYLTREIGLIIIKPVVRARTLIRLEVRGAVGHPGFHAMPTDALIDALLMRAGGPAGDAHTTDLSIVRGDTTIWTADSIRVAIRDARTIGELGLQSGDALVVPKGADLERTMRILTLVLTVPAAIIGLKLLFR